ncbi:sodium-dependent bicarbonate transport family permease [Massilia sp. GCM10023247]|uniref:sodium-dependent bicarbonate transport family permease n=1 Tax=Massilia sp. GCM10023247 TaxID=3252643 RepID=UPI003613F747
MSNFLDPAILFFAFGILAGCLKSNLDIPQPISRFLSLYLLMALGLKGGFALAQSGLTAEVAASLGAAILLAAAIPMLAYRLLKRFVSPFDAAAVAATYGSVSAVTFITATQYLDVQQVAYGGHMAAAMALMESPAILIAVVLANGIRQSAAVPVSLPAAGGAAVLGGGNGQRTGLGKILHESFTDGTQLLLLGAMLVGLLTGEAGKAAMAPFSIDLFKGMLAFFLLDMGLLTARNLAKLRGQSRWLLAYAALAPLVHASLALGLSAVLGLAPGNAALLMVLAASASYIAVPAALRYSIPEANPSVYFSMSLGITFPLNILFGIPVYTAVAGAVLG